MRAERGWLPVVGGRGFARRLVLAALVVGSAGCGKDQHALLLTVTAMRLVERFDMQVRDLVSGTVLLDRRDEPVTTPARPNRDISEATQALRLAIEFPGRGRYLLRIVGRTAANAEQNQVAVREFVIRGVQRAAVKLIANDHDADRDGFPDCAAYPDCAGLGESLSCDFLDCDDHEQAINRFGLEVCGNQLDDDCSGGCGADPSAGDEPCKDVDGDGVPGSQDCNDADPCMAPTIKEDANLCAAGDAAAQALRYALPQACRDKLAATGATMPPPFCGDGVDQDCNGHDVACIVDADCDSYPPAVDCDDTRADVNPGAVESCDDALDNNCNQVVDEGCVPCDVDGDGHAATGEPRGPSCSLPSDDCDDFDAGVSPGTAESGTGGAEGGTVLGALRRRCAAANEKEGKPAREVDHDCDGQTAAQDGCPLAVCDQDGDGFAGAAGGCNPPTARLDRNDADPQSFPGAPDRCGDGIAQNGIADGVCTGDRDADGYLAPADCADDPAVAGAAQIHPWAVEVCDGRDNDCDGLVDEGNPDGAGRLIATTAPSCSDYAQGQCAPGGRLTGRCACSRQVPTRDPRYPLDSARRTACSGEDERALSSQRCFGATQPQKEECDSLDWDCNGRADDPDGQNLADKGKACSIGAGNCTAGTVAGCDLSRSVDNAEFDALVGAGIVFNVHWVCKDAAGNPAALPVSELCNGQDDDCDGNKPGDELDADGDKYLACSGCTAPQVSGRFALAPGLSGCGDCNATQPSVFPGAEEKCNNVDDDCSNGLTDDGVSQCSGSTPNCCSQIPACVNLQTDKNQCGSCGRQCDALVADSCVGGNCVCGATGAACGAGLNCVAGQCKCLAAARCGGCCAGTSCISVPTVAQCGLNGAACQGCTAAECYSPTCETDGSCGSDPLTGTACPDDGLSCTQDLCASGVCDHTQLVAGKCLIGGVCYAAGALNPTNSCQVCTPASDPRAWSNKALRAACDGGRCDNRAVPQCCTKCLRGDGSCETSPTGAACGTGGANCSVCGGGTTCKPAVCSAAGACDTANALDGTSCAGDGKDCTKDLCQTGSCTHTELEANTCLIAGNCFPSGDRTTNTCQACVPATSTSAWTDKTVGASCTMSGSGDAGRCDGSPAPPDCCAGCLDVANSNTCRFGTTVTWCGKGGANCAACTGAGECKVNTCSAGACGIADAVNGTACAADALSCTDDTCASGSCAHPQKPNTCLISGACYAAGDDNPTNACQECAPGTSATGWTNKANGAACAPDGESCTDDVCSAGACTHPVVSGQCLIAGTCQTSGADNPANSCEECLPATSTASWTTKANGVACAGDALSCTDDKCASGSCAHPLKANTCLIGGVCYAAGDDNPTNACQECTPGTNATGWTNKVNGAACASDGVSCTDDVCSAGACTHPVASTKCLIDSTCRVSGGENPTNDCQECAPGTSTTAWTNKADGTNCDGGAGSCIEGTCTP